MICCKEEGTCPDMFGSCRSWGWICWFTRVFSNVWLSFRLQGLNQKGLLFPSVFFPLWGVDYTTPEIWTSIWSRRWHSRTASSEASNNWKTYKRTGHVCACQYWAIWTLQYLLVDMWYEDICPQKKKKFPGPGGSNDLKIIHQSVTFACIIQEMCKSVKGDWGQSCWWWKMKSIARKVADRARPKFWFMLNSHTLSIDVSVRNLSNALFEYISCGSKVVAAKQKIVTFIRIWFKIWLVLIFMLW